MGAVSVQPRPLPSLATEHGRQRPGWLVRPLAFGLLAAVGLLSFYLGLLSLAQGWAHALQQLAEDRWFVSVIAIGFGKSAVDGDGFATAF